MPQNWANASKFCIISLFYSHPSRRGEQLIYRQKIFKFHRRGVACLKRPYRRYIEYISRNSGNPANSGNSGSDKCTIHLPSHSHNKTPFAYGLPDIIWAFPLLHIYFLVPYQVHCFLNNLGTHID
jgi:hypothetical protein